MFSKFFSKILEDLTRTSSHLAFSIMSSKYLNIPHAIICNIRTNNFHRVISNFTRDRKTFWGLEEHKMTLLSSSAYVIHTTTKQVILRRIKDWNDLEMQQNEKRRVRRRKRLQNVQKEDKRTRKA